MSPMESRLQLLADMIQRIQSHGWKQGGIEDREGPNGLLSTMIVVTGSESAHKLPQYKELLAELKKRIQASSPYDNTVTWNDAPGRTMDEVIALLTDIYRDWIKKTP